MCDKHALKHIIILVWPLIQMKGCRFHLGQSWWRKIQTVDLSQEYKKNSDISIFLKYFFGLPFLKPSGGLFYGDIVSI
jgi:hypothetical protein